MNPARSIQSTVVAIAATVLILEMVVVAQGVDTCAQRAEPGEPPGAALDPVTRPAEPVANGQPGRIYLSAHLLIPQVDGSDRVLGVIAVDPQTGEWELVRDANASSLRVAADGKTVVMYVLDRVSRQSRLILFDLETKTSRDVGDFSSAIPSRDGKAAIVTHAQFPEAGGRTGLAIASAHKHWRLDLTTLEKAPLPLPADRMILDASPDLEWCLTLTTKLRPGEPQPIIQQQLIVSRSDGTEERPLPLGDGSSHGFARFAPDGKMIALVFRSPDQKPRLRVVDLDGQEERILFEAKGIDQVPESVCWSPDGKSLLSIIREPEGAAPSLRLLILDAESGAQREITLTNAEVISLRDANWR